MKTRRRVFIVLIGFFLLAGYGCQGGRQTSKEIINRVPEYQNVKYVELKKLYDIDVTEISFFSREYEFLKFIDFDSSRNLYILDPYKGTIFVFDENGNILKKFGKLGQGPGEFERPNRLVIKNDKICVFDGFFGLKILTLDGNYIRQSNVYIENPLKIKAVGDRFYLLTGKTDRTFSDLTLILKSVDDSFSGGKELFRYKHPLGLNSLPCWELLFINHKGEFYYPLDNMEKYLITKFDSNRQPLFSFGRKYTLQNYSNKAMEEIRSTFKKAIERGQMKLPDSPPVVRNIFQDMRKNIWVVAGEVYEENLLPDYENNVDIFNEDGEWLFNFKTACVSKNSFYNNGRIFRVPPLDLTTYSQKIEVYRINYLKD
jgi:hypothetical protein